MPNSLFAKLLPARREAEKEPERPLAEFHELRRFTHRLGKHEFRTVLDVGANVGDATRMFRRLWPQARVYAIEPIQSTFERLQQEFAADRKVSCFRVALGEHAGVARMTSKPLKKVNRIVSAEDAGHAPMEDVQVETGKRFCELHGITSIDFLKIDAEGFDLQVCKGFEPLLREQRIATLQVETTLQLQHHRLVPFPDILNYLHPLGYRVFKAHAQMLAGPQPMARHCNVVFVSEKVIRQHSARGGETA